MPPPTPPRGRRGGRVLAVLFWCGVGSASIAVGALLVDPGGSGPARLPVLLAVTSTVLIGLSLGLRPQPDPSATALGDEVALARRESAEADEAARLAIVKARTEVRDLGLIVDELASRLSGGGRAARTALDERFGGRQPLLRNTPATMPVREPAPPEPEPRHAAAEPDHVPEPEIYLTGSHRYVPRTTERVSVTRQELTRVTEPVARDEYGHGYAYEAYRAEGGYAEQRRPVDARPEAAALPMRPPPTGHGYDHGRGDAYGRPAHVYGTGDPQRAGDPYRQPADAYPDQWYEARAADPYGTARPAYRRGG